VVGGAHAHTTAGHHGIGLANGVVERRRERLRVVTHQAEVDHVHAKTLQGGLQAESIAVVDAARRQRLARREHLVTRGEQRHPQAALNTHGLETQRRDQPDVRGPQDATGLQCRLAAGQVFAAFAAVFTAPDHAGLDAHGIVLLLAQLLRHYGIEPGGHDRAGHDPDALAGRSRRIDRCTRIRRAHDAQKQRHALAQRGTVERVTIHRRVVVWRHVHRRHHVFGQHAAERGVQRYGLAAADRHQRRVDRGARCGDAELGLTRHQRGRAEFGHGQVGGHRGQTMAVILRRAQGIGCPASICR
jgi:hypothetical protein